MADMGGGWASGMDLLADILEELQASASYVVENGLASAMPSDR